MTDNPISEAIRSTGLPAVVDSTREFVEKLFGPAKEEGGELLRDFVGSYRWRNQLKILQKAKEFAAEADLRIDAVPLRTLVPLLESCGLEDDPALQAMWAALLASAAGRPGTAAARPAFVEIMKQISPPEAWILSEWFVQFGFPNPTSYAVDALARRAREEEAYSAAEVDASISNLVRLGLISTDLGIQSDLKKVGEAIESLSRTGPDADLSVRSALRWTAQDLTSGRRSEARLNLSPLGFQFLYAVLPPVPRPIVEPWEGETPIGELVVWYGFAHDVADEFDADPDLAAELRGSAERTSEELDRRRSVREKVKLVEDD